MIRSLYFLFLALLTALTFGCSSGGGGGGTALAPGGGVGNNNGPGTTPPPTTGSVTFNFVRAQTTTVPIGTTSLKFDFYAGTNVVLSETRPFASQIVFDNVPTSVDRVEMTGFDLDDFPTTQATRALSVEPGGDVTIGLEVEPVSLTQVVADPSSVSISGQNSTQLSFTGVFSDGSQVSLDPSGAVYSGHNELIAQVSNSGLVTAQAAGSTSVQVSYQVGASIVNTNVPISVSGIPAALVGLQVQPNSVALTSTQHQQLETTALFSDGSSVTLAPEAPNYSLTGGLGTIAQVSSTGLVSGFGPGTTSVRVSYSLGGETQEFTVPVAVEASLVELRIPNPFQLKPFETRQVSVEARFDDESTVILDPSQVTYELLGPDLNIATVNESGLVTGVAIGHGRLRVTATVMGITRQQGTDLEVIGAVHLLSGTNTFNTDTGILNNEPAPLDGWIASSSTLGVSSLRVPNGSTLYLTGTQAFRVNSFHAISIDGVVTHQRPISMEGPDVILTSNNNIGISGRLDVTGSDASQSSGGKGGDGGSVTLQASSVNINGLLRSSGGAGNCPVGSAQGFDGGAGGQVTITATSSMTCTGNIQVHGGDSFCTSQTPGHGGQGGTVLVPMNALISGTISAIGGFGSEGFSFEDFSGQGGQGGSVTLYGNNSGTINVSGGTGGLVMGSGSFGGRGGNGGTVHLVGAHLSGSLLGHGGIGGDGLDGGDGGNAGLITALSPAGGSIQFNGGRGGQGDVNGGNGGDGLSTNIPFVPGGQGGRGGIGGTGNGGNGGQGGDSTGNNGVGGHGGDGGESHSGVGGDGGDGGDGTFSAGNGGAGRAPGGSPGLDGNLIP